MLKVNKYLHTKGKRL